MKTEYRIGVTVTQDQVKNLFISAVEGGSNYWCKLLRPRTYHKTEDFYEAMFKGFFVEDSTTNGLIEVTPGAISRALRLLAGPAYIGHFADVLNENDDAETGDVFLQLCTFGKVLYG